MTSRKRVLSELGVLLLLCLGSCAGEAETNSAGPPATRSVLTQDDAGSRPARTLPIPGSEEDREASLPPGHPSAEPDARARSTSTGDAGLAILIWDKPETWIGEAPTSRMRLAQYRVPGPGGDGECVVFYFGPGQGGDPQANALRWARQFKQPDGRDSVEAMDVDRLGGTQVEVLVVAVTGTYSGGMTLSLEPAEEKPGYMLLGGIAAGPDAPWFFKFTGPEATVSANRDAFERLMRSVRRASVPGH